MRNLTKALAAPAIVSLTVTAAPSTASATPATVNRCLPRHLTVTAQSAGAAAGTFGIHLTYTNTGSACTLRGYPGVSALGTAGRVLGSPAGRDPLYPVTTQTLGHGGTAMSLLLLADVYNYPPARCHYAKGAAFRVYPPGASAADRAAYSFEGCRKPVVYMHTTAVAKG